MVNTKNGLSVVSQVFNFDPYPYLITLEEMQLNSIESCAELRARSDAPEVRMAFYQQNGGATGM
jgi:hypothetical protein